MLRSPNRPSGGLAVIAMVSFCRRRPFRLAHRSTGPRLLFCRRRPFRLAHRSTGCGGGLRGTPAIRSHLHSALAWGFITQPDTSARPARPPSLSPDGRF